MAWNTDQNVASFCPSWGLCALPPALRPHFISVPLVWPHFYPLSYSRTGWGWRLRGDSAAPLCVPETRFLSPPLSSAMWAVFPILPSAPHPHTLPHPWQFRKEPSSPKCSCLFQVILGQAGGDGSVAEIRAVTGACKLNNLWIVHRNSRVISPG